MMTRQPAAGEKDWKKLPGAAQLEDDNADIWGILLAITALSGQQ
jgi:hypothetical protein